MNSAIPFLQRPPTRAIRVLVVGFFTKQIELIRPEFPGLQIEHIEGGPESPAPEYEVRSKSSRVERVFFASKFVSHSVSAGIPRDKVVHVTGLDSLRQSLARFAASCLFSDGDDKVVPMIGVNPTGELIDMGKPMVDYTPLREAKTGALLHFTRPNGVAAHLFAQNIQSARGYFSRHFGIETTQEIRGGRAEVFVIKGADTPLLNRAECELTDQHDVVFRLPSVQEQARHFWQDVYRESFRLMPYAIPQVHAATATAACDAWLSLCGDN